MEVCLPRAGSSSSGKLQHHPDHEQRRSDATPAPSGEPVAVIDPHRAMDSLYREQERNRNNHGDNDSDGRIDLAQQEYPEQRPGHRIDDRQSARRRTGSRSRRLACSPRARAAMCCASTSCACCWPRCVLIERLRAWASSGLCAQPGWRVGLQMMRRYEQPIEIYEFDRNLCRRTARYIGSAHWRLHSKFYPALA